MIKMLMSSISQRLKQPWFRLISVENQQNIMQVKKADNAHTRQSAHNAIMHALHLQGVNSLFVEYYRAYLNTRSCKYADTLTTGVQAGNSVSSLAFSCLNYVITAMEAKGYQLTVFADDIQVSHDPNVDKDVVLMELSELLQPLGLELALEKCSSTQNGGEITFLGQTFSQTSISSLAERLTDKIDKCLKVLEASPITNHQKFLLLRSVVLPKVNYAPHVDFAPKTPLDSFDNQYGPIDQKVLKYASDLFAVKDLSETEQADFFHKCCFEGWTRNGRALIILRFHVSLVKSGSSWEVWHLQSSAERIPQHPSGSPWSTGHWLCHKQFHLSDRQ
ncbi:Reverse_transcriptase/endonuclease [Hexamita inflata]|uniref:Putative n=1 Tax=Hexamita inflata TaxID=28002 RepID=A0AA86TLP1_9EUKA|nr:Reverse transcriptase/endonuclease [Hexamita inflata]